MSNGLKEYKKMYKKHHKELIKLAKESEDWDWYYLHILVITKIRHMYEYYSAGNNVWQTDETLQPIISQLKHILDLQDELDHLHDKPIDGIQYGFVAKGVTNVSASDEALKEIEDREKRKVKLYEEIYNYIGQHLLEWWD